MRRRYLLCNKLQNKYLGILLLFMAIPCMALIAYFRYSFILFKRDLIADGLISPAVSVAFDEKTTYFLFSILILVLLLLAWGVLFSHRIAGPIGRLIKELDMVAKKKDFSHRLVVRKDDELKPLVKSMNRVLEKSQHSAR